MRREKSIELLVTEGPERLLGASGPTHFQFSLSLSAHHSLNSLLVFACSMSRATLYSQYRCHVSASMIRLARYAKRGGNFVLVVSGSLEADGTNQLIEIVYDLLIEAIQLGSLGCFEFGVSAVGLK
jgi:hypothetical protein